MCLGFTSPGPLVDFIEVANGIGGRSVVEVPEELVCDSTHLCPLVCLGPGRQFICSATREYADERRSLLSLWQQGIALPPGGCRSFSIYFGLYARSNLLAICLLVIGLILLSQRERVQRCAL